MSGDCCRNNSLYPPLFAGVQRIQRGAEAALVVVCLRRKWQEDNDGTNVSHSPPAVQMSLREKKTSGNSSA